MTASDDLLRTYLNPISRYIALDCDRQINMMHDIFELRDYSWTNITACQP